MIAMKVMGAFGGWLTRSTLTALANYEIMHVIFNLLLFCQKSGL